MLTKSKDLIEKAKQGKYAVGCFNTSDLEITKAIIAAAEALKSPVIIATSEKAIEYAGLESLAAIIKTEAIEAKVPVVLHLDHGQSLAVVDRCLEEGFTSVMFDGSKNDLEENIILTRQAVEMAHVKNIPCEGELGSLGKAGESINEMTDPNDVMGFVQKTGVDFLAISIGSRHGSLGEGSESLDIELLKEISQKTRIPLVLHGASGVSDQDIKSAISWGIAKVNIDTDIRHTFTASIREIAEKNPSEEDPRKIMAGVMEEIQKLIENKIKLFGSDGKA